LECQGDHASAGRYYETVWRTDHSHVSAAFGLARTRLRRGDRMGAIEALDSVPPSSSHHLVAQLAAIRACTRDRSPADVTEDELIAAAHRLESVELDAERRALVSVEVLTCARDRVVAGADGAGRTVLGSMLTEPDLSRGLERCYRELARLAPTKRQRIALVDQANSVRPLTWV
jgi:serine/threonine-protein kinase PknG